MAHTTTSTSGHSATRTANLKRLFIYFIAYRVICGVVLSCCAYLPPFDSSHQVILPASTTTNSFLERFISTSLRWDSFHFLEIAQRGYTYEHLYAFFPGVPTLMRASSLLFGYGTTLGMLWGSWVAVVGCYTLTTLYDLTLVHTGSHDLAMLATACSIFTTSPATLLHAPYTEPFFAFFSFKGADFHYMTETRTDHFVGMLYSAHNRWLRASLMFAVACTFRSNGVLLAGYIVWGMLLEPFSRLVSASITFGRLLTYFRASFDSRECSVLRYYVA